MASLHIRNARVVDPATGRDAAGDVYVADGKIVESLKGKAERVIEAKGLVVSPGFIDLAARLREPGQEYKATLESETAAAAAGGVTSLACPPDTDPPLDEPGLVDMLKFRARKLSRCRLFPLGALTQGLAGAEITEMIDLTEAGCVGFSQAEAPMRDNLTLSRAMQYASTRGYTVWLRPKDPSLSGGVAASGAVATRLGLSGVPVASETIAIHTIVELVRQTGARVHLCRLSSAAGVDLVRRAKAEGLPVTADVSINSLHLTDVDIGYFNADMRLVPPLRQGKDRDALRAGLADGTIDALVSDHTPIGHDDKMLPFGEAVPGATGLELLLSLALKWGNESKLTLAQALARVTSEPVRVLGEALGSLGQSAGRLVEGGVADVCVFDPHAEWQVTPEALHSRGKHTPFDAASSGTCMPGRVRHTLVAGTLAYSADPSRPSEANAA
jgi:dihydroorotase